MGNLDVAVKTIHTQHVNPHLTAQQAVRIIQKVTGCICAVGLLQMMRDLGVVSISLPIIIAYMSIALLCAASP